MIHAEDAEAASAAMMRTLRPLLAALLAPCDIARAPTVAPPYSRLLTLLLHLGHSLRIRGELQLPSLPLSGLSCAGVRQGSRKVAPHGKAHAAIEEEGPAD